MSVFRLCQRRYGEFDSSSDVLIVTQGGHTYTQQMSDSYAGEYFHLAPDTGTGTLITENGNPATAKEPAS
jgi:hypothetical protein